MRQRASPGGHGRTQLQKLRHSPSASTTSASPTSPTATRSKVKLRRKSKTKPATSMYLVHPGLAGGTSTLSPPPPAVVGARKPRRRSFQQQLAQPGSSTRLDFSSSGIDNFVYSVCRIRSPLASDFHRPARHSTNILDYWWPPFAAWRAWDWLGLA